MADLEEENAMLREEVKLRDELEGKLIRCIENDYDILFTWDPLRKVWLSECTDEYINERKRLRAENAELQQRITTQKQTIQAYRDESREWREVADRVQAENAKLRELAGMMLSRFTDNLPDSTEKPCDLCDMWDTCSYVNDMQCRLLDNLRELGVEVSS